MNRFWPGGPNARTDGNVWVRPTPPSAAQGRGAVPRVPQVQELKWTQEEFAEANVYDQRYGVPLAKRFHYNRPPTILACR